MATFEVELLIFASYSKTVISPSRLWGTHIKRKMAKETLRRLLEVDSEVYPESSPCALPTQPLPKGTDISKRAEQHSGIHAAIAGFVRSPSDRWQSAAVRRRSLRLDISSAAEPGSTWGCLRSRAQASPFVMSTGKHTLMSTGLNGIFEYSDLDHSDQPSRQNLKPNNRWAMCKLIQLKCSRVGWGYQEHLSWYLYN